MSVSTNAYLFYGICWDKEDHIWPWRSDDWDDIVTSPLEIEQRAKEEETDDEWLARVLPTLADKVTIGEHCMRSCSMGYVAIPTTHERAWRGYPKKLQLASGLTDDAEREMEEDWRRTLRGFCEAVGYDFDVLDKAGKVGWFLCSWWEE